MCSTRWAASSRGAPCREPAARARVPLRGDDLDAGRGGRSADLPDGRSRVAIDGGIEPQPGRRHIRAPCGTSGTLLFRDLPEPEPAPLPTASWQAGKPAIEGRVVNRVRLLLARARVTRDVPKLQPRGGGPGLDDHPGPEPLTALKGGRACLVGQRHLQERFYPRNGIRCPRGGAIAGRRRMRRGAVGRR